MSSFGDDPAVGRGRVNGEFVPQADQNPQWSKVAIWALTIPLPRHRRAIAYEILCLKSEILQFARCALRRQARMLRNSTSRIFRPKLPELHMR